MADRIRIRLLTIAAGPHFNLQPGEVEVDAEQAEAMIEAGHATRIDIVGEADREAVVEVEDVAVRNEPGPPETATAPPQRSAEADELVAFERAGTQAAAAGGLRRTPDGIDGRSPRGKAWLRGFDSYRAPEKERAKAAE